MSVINQMLKDLEQRTPEHGQASAPVMINNKSSIVKVVLITLLLLTCLNALGFYIWHLQTQVAEGELKLKHSLAQTAVAAEKLIAEKNNPAKAEQVITSKTAATTAQEAELKRVNTRVNKHVDANVGEGDDNIVEANADANAEASVMAIAKPDKVKMTSLKAAEVTTNTPEILTTRVSTTSAEQMPQAIAKLAPPAEVSKSTKMTVSRRQLSVDELVTKKLLSAEKAINASHISQAEKLFEEVLILQPTNKQARKKLAALWFGRKSYQQALNLLSQGIVLDKQDAELRMLKAQIQIQQGQQQGAYQTLNALPALEQQDYQLMLANVAQQVQAYPSAISAYQLLIKMQPYSGKWHLGLAIVYDKNSQFSLAETAYARALSKTDLSKASAEFAQQRMQALGE